MTKRTHAPKTFADDEIKALIGARVREQRMLRGLTMEQLAEKVGLANSQIGRYETAENAIDSVMLVRIAQAIGCTVHVLMVDVASDTGAVPALHADAINIALIVNTIHNGGLRLLVKQWAEGLAKWEHANGRG